ncbi:MAG TPA: hypothetical protein ENF15_01000 [Candidatus Acetothermia bacterium]|nr:hypothetical protein [Candidatus Acetothermia bacterium]
MEINGTRKGNNNLLRRHNRALIVNLFRHKGPLSRADLSRLTGLAPSVLSRLSAELIAEGLVWEPGKIRAPSGRPPVLLSLNSGDASAVGIKIEKERALAARVDLLGEVQAETAVPFADLSLAAAISATEEAIAEVFGGKTPGVGIAASRSMLRTT